MIVKCKGVVTDIVERESNGRKFLNGKLRSSVYDYDYLVVGIRVDMSNVDTVNGDLVLDIKQSWVDTPNGKKDCRTHITLVGIE